MPNQRQLHAPVVFCMSAQGATGLPSNALFSNLSVPNCLALRLARYEVHLPQALE